MRRFLQETWELWYWAMFCPSKLQERMNTWGQGIDQEVRSSDILLKKPNRRFIKQYFLAIGLLCLPLCLLVISSGRLIDFLLLPAAILTAYCISSYSIPIGINWPILYGFTYARFANISEAFQLGLSVILKHINYHFFY